VSACESAGRNPSALSRRRPSFVTAGRRHAATVGVRECEATEIFASGQTAGQRPVYDHPQPRRRPSHEGRQSPEPPAENGPNQWRNLGNSHSARYGKARADHGEQVMYPRLDVMAAQTSRSRTAGVSVIGPGQGIRAGLAVSERPWGLRDGAIVVQVAAHANEGVDGQGHVAVHQESQ
jgi:hypothetical protein